MSTAVSLCRQLVSKTSLPLAQLGRSIAGRCVVVVQQPRLISKKTYDWPTIQEADLEEEFVRGSGPGGQSVAKTNNCVVLKHKPSGITVKCHDTRSQFENRRLARERLVYQLDIQINKERSFDAVSRRESSQRQKDKERRSKQKLELKKAFKLREGLTKQGEDC